MASGLEHYQKAEIAQVAAAAMQASCPGGPNYTPTEALLDALVHAALALAAATALNDSECGMSTEDHVAWRQAAGGQQ